MYTGIFVQKWQPWKSCPRFRRGSQGLDALVRATSVVEGTEGREKWNS